MPEDILLQNPGLMLVDLANNMMTVRQELQRVLGRRQRAPVAGRVQELRVLRSE